MSGLHKCEGGARYEKDRHFSMSNDKRYEGKKKGNSSQMKTEIGSEKCSLDVDMA